MNENELKELYDAYWRDYFPVTASFDNHIRIDWMLDSGLKFGTVLEIGTGNGDGLLKLINAGKKAIGIEYSHYLYENLLKSKFLNGEIIEADVCSLPFNNNSFDMVCSFDVLEHLPEEKINKAISEIYRVCKQYFYGSISTKIDQFKKFHLTIQPREWWINKFIDIGFKSIDMFNIESNPEMHCYEKL